MIFLDISSYIGRFHPLLVHLPIGFLILAALFDILSKNKKYENLKPTIPLILLVSFVSAIVACFLGWLLSQTGDYDPIILQNHKYSGIGLAVVSLVLYFLKKPIFKISDKIYTYLMLGQMALLSYTGHQGGNLTHGADYLSLSNLTEKEKVKPASIEQAMVFEDIILPVLENKCQQCHQNGKMKGDLRMLTYEDLLKGGKHGSEIVAGDAKKSELYHRVTLDPAHKEFMPTDGKPALTKEEIELLGWWINEGKAQKQVLFSRVSNNDKFKATAMAVLGLGGATLAIQGNSKIKEIINPEIPKNTNEKAIQEAIEGGFNIRKMHQNPDMLDVSFVNKSQAEKLNLSLLKPLSKNIIWLNLNELSLNNNAAEVITQLSNLEKLRLEKNNIDDIFITKILSLKHLNAINLNQTKVSILSVQKLREMKAMKAIYIWNTAIAPAQIKAILQDTTKAKIVI